MMCDDQGDDGEGDGGDGGDDDDDDAGDGADDDADDYGATAADDILTLARFLELQPWTNKRLKNNSQEQTKASILRVVAV